MYKSILIPTDGSDLANKAVMHGLELAKSLGATVTVMTATSDWSPSEMAERIERGAAHPVEDFERKAAAWADKVLSECAAAARKTGVDCKTVHAKDRSAADGIVETAKSAACDLIVMASHGRGGIGRILLGSVAMKVLTYSTVPVLICR